MQSKFQKKWVVAVCAIICCALWGSAYPCIKIGYGLFKVYSSDTLSQILFAGCRFTLAGILILLFNLVLSKKFLKPAKENYPHVAILALFQTAMQYIFFYVGLANSTGVKSAIIGASNVFLLVIASCFVFRQERITTKKVIGCIIGFIGVLLVTLTGQGIGSINFMGDGFIFFSSICYALSSCLIKNYSQTENPVTLSAYQFFFGGIIMILIGIIGGGRIHLTGFACIALIIYMAFISAMSYTLWGILMKYNNPSSVAIYGFANPIFGTTLSAIFLNEGDVLAGVKCIIALVLVTIGVLIVNYTHESKVSN